MALEWKLVYVVGSRISHRDIEGNFKNLLVPNRKG